MNQLTGHPDAALHHLLLRIAGWAPDGMLYAVRDWLARGRLVEVAQAVTFAALAQLIPLTAADVALLADILAGAGADAEALADLPHTDGAVAPPFDMSPVDPRYLAEFGDQAPHSLDLSSGTPWLAAASPDDLDRAAIAATTAVLSPDRGMAPAAGLWRAWRCPAIATPWPPPRRVYLVQAATADESSLPPLAARLQRSLVDAGEADPQVEVFVDADALPPYQRTALGHSALLWTAQPGPPVRIASVFDAVDEVGGPGFAASRSRIDGDERGAVLAYLDGGLPVLMTTAMMDDVLEPGRHGVVPMSFRTDGEWIWTDASAYYLRHYALAPDAALLDHIRVRGYAVPAVDAVARHRAMAALDDPPLE